MGGTDEGLSAEERAAIKERAREVRPARGRKADPEKAVREKIAELAGEDRAMAERVHEIVRASAPGLTPKLWYGMPGYARDGRLVVFFQAASKYGTRYSTLGFEEDARLDDGAMWPTAFAITALTPDVEERIATLVRAAAG